MPKAPDIKRFTEEELLEAQMPPQEPYSFAYAGELAAHVAGDPSEMSRAEVVGRMLDQARRTKETSETQDAPRTQPQKAPLDPFVAMQMEARAEGLRRDRALVKSRGNDVLGGHTGANRVEAMAHGRGWSREITDRVHGTRERIGSWADGPVELVEAVPGEWSEPSWSPEGLVFSAPDGGHYSVEWESDVVTYLPPGEYGGPALGGLGRYWEEGVSREEETLMGGLPVDKR